MQTQSFRNSFFEHVGNDRDPHDCWQPDGFHPDRVEATLDDLHVWAWTVSQPHLLEGGLVAYLDFISGRTLPEMIVGFRVLGCETCADVGAEILNRFCEPYPRDDAMRTLEIAQNRGELYRLETSLLSAVENDKLTAASEDYCQEYCRVRDLPPSEMED